MLIFWIAVAVAGGILAGYQIGRWVSQDEISRLQAVLDHDRMRELRVDLEKSNIELQRHYFDWVENQRSHH